MSTLGIFFNTHWPQVIVYLLVLARISGLLIRAPFWGGAVVPRLVRVFMAVSLSAALFPVVAEPRPELLDASQSAPSLLFLLSALLGEVLLGLAFGWSAQIVFAGMRYAGQQMELKMGMAVAKMVDPMSGGQRGIIASFLDLLAALVFFALNGHVLLLQALVSSYGLFPLGGEKPLLMYGLVAAASEIFSIALRVSAPVVVGLLLTDMVLGVMSRAVPQMNVFFVGLPLQLGFGLLLLFLAIPTIVWFFVHLMEDGRFDPFRLVGAISP